MSAEAVLKHLPLSSLRPSATNPRKSFDAAALEELADSIREQGLQVPLLVRPVFESPIAADDCYEVVCGERRYRAARMVSCDAGTVPCLVKEMTDAEVLDVQITENLQRADVHPVEEAAAYAALIEAAAWPSDPNTLSVTLTAEDVARKVGKRLDYVAKRMKLLTLHELATRLFAEGHIALDHALRLAVLTPKNQVGAMCFLLGIAAWEIKKTSPAELVIARRMDSWAEQQTMEHRQQYAGRRLVSPTEAELKRWIADHVLLQLKTAPWRLDDAGLVPAAGACTTCPKRSGSNVALFGDLTAEDDVCLDAECFAGKRKAHVQYLVNEAKVSGGILLKLSSKPGEEKLPDGGVTEKTLLKKGQWVPAPDLPGGVRSCAAAAPGLLRDGEDAGKVLMVCALQSCKVHQHKVAGAKAGIDGPTPEQLEREAKKKEKLDLAIATEEGVRTRVYLALEAKLPDAGLVVMRRLVLCGINHGEWHRAARWLGLLEIVHAKPDEARWELERRQSDAAKVALGGFIAQATFDQLARVALELIAGHERKVDAADLRELADSREELWAFAKEMGVDAGKIAARCQPPAGNAAAKKGAKAPGKKAAKKVALKKAKVAPKPKKLSAKSRQAIADAMQKRWNGAKTAAKKAAAKVAGGKAAKQ